MTRNKSKSEFKFVLASFGVHVAIFGLVLMVKPSAPPAGKPGENASAKEITVPVQLVEIGEGGVAGVSTEQAFNGRPLDIPLTAKEVGTQNVKKIQKLTSVLSRLGNLGKAMKAGKPGSAAKLDAKSLDQAIGAANASLAATAARSGGGKLASTSLLVADTGKTQKTIDSSEEARVRGLFEKLQPKLSVAYDAAQKSDPRLSLALTYAGTVDRNGYLSGIKFQAKGEYTNVGLDVLQKQVGRVLSGAYIGKHLEGVTIRGERLFVQ